MKFIRLALIDIVLMLVFFGGLSSASAASPSISKSYQSSGSLSSGDLVSLDGSGAVQAANTSNSKELLGIVDASNQSLLAVNPSNSKVQVATEGTVNALVSNINGNISVGQEIAVSPFNGVGMAAAPGDRVIGTTVTSFNTSTKGAEKEQVTAINGSKNTVYVGFVKVNISVGYMANTGGGLSISALQKFVEDLTGHSITAIRIISCMIIATIVLVATIIIIYASIYGSIISVGRNPLAKFAVFRTLASVIGMITFIVGIGTAAIYLLLY